MNAREAYHSMLDVTKILAKTDLFSGLVGSSLERIVSHLKKISFAQGLVICREGDIGHSMYIIVKGSVSISSNMGWGQRELDRMGPGSVFGEMALISNDVRSATVRTLTETECLELDSHSFDLLIDQDPALAQRIAKIMTRRFSSLVHRTSNELLESYRTLIFALANMTEFRDPETGAHLERTRNYCVLLAELLYNDERYHSEITFEFIDGMYQAAPLHDIGKVAISDIILFKPEGLAIDEYDRMKAHTTIGASMMDKVITQSGSELFRMAYRICLYHHECWNGSGYPVGLKGNDIPLEARIMTLADVYDALLSKRVYKAAISMRDAAVMIQQGAGTHFDPVLTEIMIANIEKFEDIYHKYQDAET